MDGHRFKPNPNFGLKQCGTRLVDRISSLPDEIIGVILSFLSLREAAKTSVLSWRWVDLWKHTPNPNSDRISRLPHSILVHILSFLPLTTAAATSVLCSRWPDLWKHTPNLDFTIFMLKVDIYTVYHIRTMLSEGKWDAGTCKHVQLVNSVIKSHKAPSLKRFNISLQVNKSATCIVAKWLEFAFLRGVETLVLDFSCINPHYKVDLEESLQESGLCSSPEKTLILLKSLKRLRISYLKVSGEAVKIFLRNCPLLEELIICRSTVISNVEVCGTSLLLKHLELLSTRGKKSLRVSAPNLTRFTFSDTVGELFIESLPKLVEAEFEFQNKRVDDVIQNVAPALFSFSSQLEILKLRLECPKVFLANEFPEMPKLRKLVVEYSGVKTHSLLPVTALLWASTRLEEFKLVFREIRRGDAPIVQVRRNGERCSHLHLKLFELAGFCDGAVGLVELATHISYNCTGLEKINIFPGDVPFSYRAVASDFEGYKRAAREYANQQLQGKLPQHIQLQICTHYHDPSFLTSQAFGNN